MQEISSKFALIQHAWCKYFDLKAFYFGRHFSQICLSLVYKQEKWGSNQWALL